VMLPLPRGEGWDVKGSVNSIVVFLSGDVVGRWGNTTILLTDPFARFSGAYLWDRLCLLPGGALTQDAGVPATLNPTPGICRGGTTTRGLRPIIRLLASRGSCALSHRLRPE